MTWDYIIVGSGSAGAVVANRLSADPTIRVLLLEVGGEDANLRYKLPAMCIDCIGNAESDWMFMAEPDPTWGGKVDMLSRGKVLGGSSSINGIIYVRGNRGDYDGWAQMGNTGWDYDTMIGHFRAVEHNSDGISDVYGTEGGVKVSQLRGVHPLAHVFISAMEELGYPRNPDYNGENSEGASIAHATQHMGLRSSTAKGFLHPIRNRRNLTIETRAHVQRLVIDGRRAVGVVYDRDGTRMRSAPAMR